VNRRNARRGLTGPGSDVRVDFYHVDSMDTLNYLPIYRHLPGAALVCVPNPAWFDIERTEAILAREQIVGRATPSPDARVVVATQYYQYIDRREYRGAVKVRLMYGIAEKLGNRNHSPYWSAPYDATLVPGEFSRRLIAAFSRAIVVGFPKYDAFFRGECDRGALQRCFGLDSAKRTILYLPTWSHHSSLVPYGRAMVALFASLASEFNVVLKPHTVTVRHERDRLELFRPLIDAGQMILIEEQVNLADLFTVSEFALADAQSGAFWETVLIGGLPVLALCLPPDRERATLEARMPEVALVSRGATFLADDVRALLAGARDVRSKAASVANELLAYRDGTAGRRAADVLLELAADGPRRSIYKSVYRLKVKIEAARREHRGVRLALLAVAPRELAQKAINKLRDAARRARRVVNAARVRRPGRVRPDGGAVGTLRGWLLPKTRWEIAQKAEMGFWRGWFREHPDGDDDRWLQTVLDYFELKVGQDFGSETIVDIGAGPIGVLTKLKAKVRIAVDPLAMDSLDKTIRRLRAPGEATTLDTGIADRIFMYNVLQHVCDVEKVLYELVRIAKPGSIIYVLEQLDLPTCAEHPHSLRIETFDRWVEKSGLTIQKRTRQMDCYFDHPSVPGSGYSILCLIVRKAEAAGQ
jgi:hypothetical protein